MSWARKGPWRRCGPSFADDGTAVLPPVRSGHVVTSSVLIPIPIPIPILRTLEYVIRHVLTWPLCSACSCTVL
jgi:hypothetical protein